MTKNQRRIKRDINGVLLLDKPLGYSSNAALQTVKRLFSAKKAGHTGSLDPLATGMLPICLGEATKYSQYLLGADKRYQFTIRLGQVTSTGDVEGDVIEEQPVSDLTGEQIEAALAGLRGAISQRPPMYSALKHNGTPLYKLARKGIEVDRPLRDVMIHSLICERVSLPEIELSVHCSKGTYVRSLAQDIGEVLGCGAHVVKLHRVAVGNFSAESMLSLAHLQELAADDHGDANPLDCKLLSIESMLGELPRHRVLAHTARRLMLGQRIVPTPGLPESVPICVVNHRGDFIGVAEVDGKSLNPLRMRKRQRTS